MEESPAARFAAACRRGVLAYQWDAEARRAVYPPRALPGLEWRESAGLGTVYAATAVHRRGEPPAGVVLVDLDEGFRMMSRVAGVAPADVRIGMRVRVAFEDDVPVFEVAD